MRGFVLLLPLLLAGCRQVDPGELYRQAEQHAQQSQWTEAMGVLDRAPRDPLFTLLRVEVLLGQGNLDAADALLPKEPFSEAALEARRLMHQGNMARLRGQTELALPLLRQALERAAPTPAIALAAELRLTAALTRSGALAAADASARRALALATSERLPHAQLQASGNLGFVALNAHRYEEAIAWFEQVRKLSQTPGNEEKALGNLALCYRALGDSERALGLLRQAETLANTAGQRHDAMVWIGQAGSILFERGDYAGSAEHFRRALTLSEALGTSFTAAWAHNLARSYLERGDATAAEPFLAKANALADPNDRALRAAVALTRARLSERRDRLPEAEATYQGIAADAALPPADRQEALGRWARLLHRSRRSAEAAERYRELLRLGESTRAALQRDDSRLSYGSSVASLYAEYVDFLMETGQTLSALDTAAVVRGRLLGGTPLGSAGLRQLAAASGHVILFYSLGPERSWLWTITGQGVQASQLPGAKTLGPLIQRYGQLIEGLGDPAAGEDPTRRRLTEILLYPAAASLPPGSRVYLALDGALQAINFETLASPHRPDHYWIEDATISVAPSLSRLAGGRRASVGTGALLMGAPAAMPEPYQPLPFAVEELDTIAATFGAGAVQKLTGAECTRPRLLAAEISRYRFVHFAVHAVADGVDPLHSALLLGRHEEGSAVTAAELRRLPWEAELVTLSACRSAGARTYGGEGLVGLAWAFLEAGAGNVIAGLWDVNDRSTARLMGELYGRMARRERPAEALRAAKLKMLQSPGAYAKPYYWAAFVLFSGAK